MRHDEELCILAGAGAYSITGSTKRTKGEATAIENLERNGMSQSLTLMTIKEVAELLHYSTKTVYKKAAKGEIPSVPISRRKRLFSRETIHYWLANKQMGNL